MPELYKLEKKNLPWMGGNRRRARGGGNVVLDFNTVTEVLPSPKAIY